MPPELDDDDWRQAFRFASFRLDEVVEVLVLAEGRPHTAAWLGVFRLRDGRFALLRATCCGAGWTCHADGDAAFAASVEDLARDALSATERARLGL